MTLLFFLILQLGTLPNAVTDSAQVRRYRGIVSAGMTPAEIQTKHKEYAKWRHSKHLPVSRFKIDSTSDLFKWSKLQ